MHIASRYLVAVLHGGGQLRFDVARRKTDGTQLSLLRVALSEFSTRPVAAPEAAYESLPAVAGWEIQNRFVGEHLVYGTGTSWGASMTEERCAPGGTRGHGP